MKYVHKVPGEVFETEYYRNANTVKYMHEIPREVSETVYYTNKYTVHEIPVKCLKQYIIQINTHNPTLV